MQSLSLEENEILVSFDVISFFTKVPIDLGYMRLERKKEGGKRKGVTRKRKVGSGKV